MVLISCHFSVVTMLLSLLYIIVWFFFFQAEDGIRDLVRSRGLGDVYKRQGNKDAAKNDFNQALIINPSNAEVKARLAGL